MFYTRKLKPDRSIGGLIPPFVMLFLFGVSALIFGYSAGFMVLAGIFWIFALYSFYIYIRTGNTGHLVVCAYQVFVGFMGVLAPRHILSERFQEWRVAWIFGIISFSVPIIYLVATKKIKWRGREIFELAAEPVEETGNGYTPRPRPIGKVEFTKQEILAFSRFIARHLIAVAYINPRQVTFVPVKMGDEYTFMFRASGGYPDTTWVNFDFEGDVSVHISQKDYLDYREPLAFDKLCETLGQLFIEFAGMHQRGEGVRIIDRLDALKLSYFS